jgi:hypothetical protein
MTQVKGGRIWEGMNVNILEIGPENFKLNMVQIKKINQKIEKIVARKMISDPFV